MDDRRVLRDADEDAALRAQDHVIRPFLTPDEVQHLQETYAGLAPDGDPSVALDYTREDRELVRRLSKELRAVLEPRVDEVFVDHEPVMMSFIVKQPGPETDFYLHRDITANDGRHARCFTLWIPLVTVGAAHDNGGLGLIPRSNRLPTGEHGLDASVLVEPFEDHLLGLLEPLEIGAGEVLIYDARLLHASPPNRSDAARPAIGCAIGRRGEPLVQIVPTGRRHRVVYAIDHAFFIDHHPAAVSAEGMPDKYEVVDEFDDVAELSATDVSTTLGGDPPEPVPRVPADVVPDGTRFEPFPTRRAPVTVPDADVSLGADDLEPIGATVASAAVGERCGAIGVSPLVADGRRVGRAPDGLPSLGAVTGRLRTRDASLVVLDPGARLDLAVPAARRLRTELITLECPQVRSGVLGAGKAVNLDLGRSVTLPDGEPVTLWNNGPGPVVAVVRQVRGWP